VETLYAAEYGETKKFATEKGSFEMLVLAMRHEEPTTFGFKLWLDGKVLGYISDTEYMESLGKDFAGCDCLIVNCMKPESDSYAGHLRISELIEVAKQAKPKLCVMTHMGLKMLRAGPVKEAEKVEKESGVKTVAARDGMKLTV